MSDDPAAAGEYVGGDKITVGDIAGSNIAIGAGAKVINRRITVNLKQMASVAELKEDERHARAQLGAAVQRLTADFAALSGKSGEPPPGWNPYVGLDLYDVADAPYFYGREADIAAIFQKIQNTDFMVLYADSGAGKSSLIKAGLMSRLISEGQLPLYLRLYRDTPDNELKDLFFPNAIKKSKAAGDGQELNRLDQWLLGQSLRSFLLALKETLGQARMVIFLDQFEDFFRLPREKQEAFVAELAACMEDDGLRQAVHWVIALRKEYLGDLDLFSGSIAFNPLENYFFLKRLSEEQTRQVITEPVSAVDVAYEPAVVEAILTDLRLPDGSYDPPQIQIVCQTLFEERAVDGRVELITSAVYNREREGAPGAQGILRDYFTRVMRAMRRDNRDIAFLIFDALVVAERRTAETRAHICRQVQAAGSATDEDVARVLGMLVDSRLLRVYGDDEDVESLYEIIHDYLLTLILRDPENRDRKFVQELLDSAVYAWERDNTFLIEGQRLRLISGNEGRLHIDDDAQRLIDASRRSIRLRWARIGAGVLAIALLALAVPIFGPRLIYRPPAPDTVPVPAGSFQMGLSAEEASAARALDIELDPSSLVLLDSEQPQHTVTLAAYHIDRREVTAGAYRQCTKANVCPEPESRRFADESLDDLPVTGVSWTAARRFCEWMGGRLPTEAEWERAAKGDAASAPRYPWGDRPDAQQAWVDVTSDTNAADPRPAGSFAPAGVSAFGAADMSGNVWEWTADWFDRGYYAVSPEENPTGPQNGERKVLRGGSYANNWMQARTTFRKQDLSPGQTSEDVGFRCVMEG